MHSSALALALASEPHLVLSWPVVTPATRQGLLASGCRYRSRLETYGHASIAIMSDVYGHPVGTIAQKAVDGAASQGAQTVHT